MVSRHRRPLTGFPADVTRAAPPPDSEYMTLEEFWELLADETEAMSNEELRAELAQLRICRITDLH
jgi:hypothetical protein